MPRFDGTGPNGDGSKTGGQRGICAGAMKTGNNQGGFWGFMRNCFGFGRRFNGRGCGRGNRRWFYQANIKKGD